MKYFDYYDLQLFNPLIGGYEWYRIEMPMVQGDAETQIALFLLCKRGPAPFLGGKNDETPHFFQK